MAGRIPSCAFARAMTARSGSSALRESGQEKNTVVILSIDHGDMAGAHRMEHKTALYEEAVRIPLIVMHKGTAPAAIRGGAACVP